MEKEETVGAKGVHYLTFDIGGEEYAVSILGITEIVDCNGLQVLPGSPDHVRGLLFRGSAIVPVVDLALVQGLPATPLSRWTCIVLIELEQGSGREPVGVLVDILTCRIKSAQALAAQLAPAPAPVPMRALARAPAQAPAPLEWPTPMQWGKPVRGIG